MTTEALFQCDDYRRMYAACCADLQNATGWGALRDHDCPEVIVQEAEPFILLDQFDIHSFGRGIGSGIGSGIGRGIGRGSGRGIGSGSVKPYEVRQMEVGKCYLLHCGDWHTFVGRVVRQSGPMTYVLEGVSKILETNNGDCWDALAAGDQRLRAAATYAHYKTPGVFPLSIAAFEWEGQLPQET